MQRPLNWSTKCKNYVSFTARIRFLLLFLFLMGNIWMVIKLVSLMQLSVSRSWGICPSFAARLGAWWLSRCHLHMLWVAGGMEIFSTWWVFDAKLVQSFWSVLYSAAASCCCLLLCELQTVIGRILLCAFKMAWKRRVFFLLTFQSFGSHGGSILICFNMSCDSMWTTDLVL